MKKPKHITYLVYYGSGCGTFLHFWRHFLPFEKNPLNSGKKKKFKSILSFQMHNAYYYTKKSSKFPKPVFAEFIFGGAPFAFMGIGMNVDYLDFMSRIETFFSFLQHLIEFQAQKMYIWLYHLKGYKIYIHLIQKDKMEKSL